MHVLHIDTGLEMRGGQRQVLILLQALREAGHDCTLLAAKSGQLFPAALQSEFAVHTADAAHIWRLSPKADLVHVHDARAHTLAAISCRRKFVVSRRVAFPVRRSLASLWKYQRPARFLAVSRFVAQELAAAGLRHEKIDVVYDAVSDHVPDADWSPTHPVIALASRDREKGRDLVERASAMGPFPVRFSDTLESDLRHGSVFLYITRSEGLGSAVLLAMAMGVPVIASCVGGLTEVFEDEISGLFVHNDPPEITKAVQRVRNDPALAQMLIDGAKRRIAESFTTRHLREATLRSYRRALSSDSNDS
ncbi:MAG TPA: glycosyltransferase family 4 protein [Bryobacteraceae bacterium]|nr:glycosyltransferase family 4 protein [Bryobacteraceae bacterium]